MLRSLVVCLSLVLVAPASAQTRQPRTDLDLRATYAPVVRETAPAVVNIYTRRNLRNSSMMDDPIFGFFFRRQTQPQSSLGSGVILDPDGLVVTNNHVIENMDEIRVVLADRREFEAELLLADPQTDLAILRIDAPEPLPTLEFADSDSAQVGDIVLAIGNPFGVGQTVTSGIVSALSRTNVSVSDYQFFIQTDAAINPGNSGGALVDVDGRLLGINTAIYSRSGGSNGIGFAIPGNLVRRVLSSAAGGETMVMRPWLGVIGSDVDSRIAVAIGLDRPRGALISQLYPGGPADRAGLREGDVVLSIGGQEVIDGEALRYRPATREAGERIEVVYLRDGRERSARVRLDLPPMDPEPDTQEIVGEPYLIGVTVSNLSPALNEELGRNPFDKGVVVTGLDPRRASRRTPVREGYTILSVNGEATPDVESLNRALSGGLQSITVRNTRGQTQSYRIRR